MSARFIVTTRLPGEPADEHRFLSAARALEFALGAELAGYTVGRGFEFSDDETYVCRCGVKRNGPCAACESAFYLESSTGRVSP